VPARAGAPCCRPSWSGRSQHSSRVGPGEASGLGASRAYAPSRHPSQTSCLRRNGRHRRCGQRCGPSRAAVLGPSLVSAPRSGSESAMAAASAGTMAPGPTWSGRSHHPSPNPSGPCRCTAAAVAGRATCATSARVVLAAGAVLMLATIVARGKEMRQAGERDQSWPEPGHGS
jgi:hypothetical protein